MSVGATTAQLGDLITAFCLGRIRYGKVIDVRDEGEVPKLQWIPIIPPVPRAALWVNVHDENITWLAGHHSIDDLPVKALWAARALT